MGRPREFDEDRLLASVTDLFWRRGYEAVSMREVAEATGVKMASLYAAYGDKRGLYGAALEYYNRTVVTQVLDMLGSSGAARNRIAKLLKIPIDAAASGDRRGCFLCNAAVDQACNDDAAAQLVTKSLKQIEEAIARTLSGLRRYAQNPSARRRVAQRLLAEYLGMRVLARSGSPVGVLKNIRTQTLAAL